MPLARVTYCPGLLAGEHVTGGALAALGRRPGPVGLHRCGGGPPPLPAFHPDPDPLLRDIAEHLANGGGDNRIGQLSHQHFLDAEPDRSARRLPRPLPPAVGRPVLRHAVENRQLFRRQLADHVPGNFLNLVRRQRPGFRWLSVFVSRHCPEPIMKPPPGPK